eukprot:4160755-Pleurochrysis_carterae.AAC.1
MRLRLERLLQPTQTKGGFLMSGDANGLIGSKEREGAMHYLWSRNYANVFTEILDSNPDIGELLDQRTTSVYNSRLNADLLSDVRRGRRLNFVGGLLARNRN